MLPPTVQKMDGVDKMEKIEGDEVAEYPESWLQRTPPALLGFDIQSSNTAPEH